MTSMYNYFSHKLQYHTNRLSNLESIYRLMCANTSKTEPFDLLKNQKERSDCKMFIKQFKIDAQMYLTASQSADINNLYPNI